MHFNNRIKTHTQCRR